MGKVDKQFILIPVVALLGATFPLTTVALVIANLLGQRK